MHCIFRDMQININFHALSNIQYQSNSNEHLICYERMQPLSDRPKTQSIKHGKLNPTQSPTLWVPQCHIQGENIQSSYLFSSGTHDKMLTTSWKWGGVCHYSSVQSTTAGRLGQLWIDRTRWEYYAPVNTKTTQSDSTFPYCGGPHTQQCLSEMVRADL